MSDTTTDQTTENTDEIAATSESVDIKEPQAGDQKDTRTLSEKSPEEQAEHWKTHARTWEDRQKKTLAESEAKDARIATLEKALEEGTDATEALTTSRAQAVRYRTALDLGMDAATADTVLTATDPEQIEAQAAAFKAGMEAAGKSAERAPREPVPESPNQGAPGPAKPDYRAQADRIRNMR